MVNDVARINQSVSPGRAEASVQPVTAIPTAGQGAPQNATSKDAKAPGSESSPAAAQVESLLRSMQPPLIGEAERLSIIRDETTGTFIYRSINKETGQVLNQWPAESMLQFKAYLKKAEGVLFDRRA